MQQDGGIDRGRIECRAVLLREKHRVAHIGKEHAERQPHGSCQQGDDEVLAQDLSHQLAARAAEGAAHANLAHTAAQAALRHAAQVDGRHDEEDEKDDPPLAARGLHVGFPVGRHAQGVLLLVVGAVAADELPAFLG